MSKSYSKVELLIAGFLSRFPKLKIRLKNLYQRFNFFIHAKKYDLSSDFSFKKLSLHEGYESFFGYYDKTPINPTDEFIVFYSANSSTKNSPNPAKPLDIVLYDIKNDTKEIVLKSVSYNWQQGCRLQWIDSYEFICNIYNEQKSVYQSVIFNVKELRVKEVLSLPIYDCYKDIFGMTLNFAYLGSLAKDYGYFNLNQDKVEFDKEGLWRIDLKNSTYKLVLSFEDIVSFTENEYSRNSKHTINHIMISPDGRRVIFIHRWYINERRFDRLMLCNCDGTELQTLSSGGVVSHCNWHDKHTIIGYFHKENNGLTYYKLNILTHDYEKLGSGIIDVYGDGHPSVQGNKLLFDTYPDKSAMQNLFLFDMTDCRLDKIAELKHPLEFSGSSRCDLHPRFGNNSGTFFVDSVYQGQRNLYMISK